MMLFYFMPSQEKCFNEIFEIQLPVSARIGVEGEITFKLPSDKYLCRKS